MAEPKGLLNKNLRVFLLVIVCAVVVSLIVQNIGVFGNILKVIIGFGLVVLVHEFGHFIAAKLSGIKVEAFSIGFPPILAGIRRTEAGYRIRILPKFFPKENDEVGDGRLSFTIGGKNKAGETEYRLGIIPFGGFVKMLGQEDTGPAKASDDPRSFANKSIGARMAVIAAGVIFNAISAVLIFMMVFLIGIELVPAVVGGVRPDSPAARAGIRAGDEVIEIAGKSDNLDFRDILIAALLSDRDQKVTLKAKHEDGSVEEFELVAEQMQTPKGPMRLFGIELPMSLTIAEVSDSNALLEKTGLFPGDRIKSVNGKDVDTYWGLEEIVENSSAPVAAILAERSGVSGKSELVESKIKLDWNFADQEVKEVKSESDLSHICSMVPRLWITVVLGKHTDSDSEPCLQAGDIILAVGDVENPTYKELRDVTTEYEDKKLPVKIWRAEPDGAEKLLTVTVVPKRSKGSNRVMIGIGVALDAEHAVVAKTIDVKDGPAALSIPRGAVVTAVDGVRVSSFYDCLREIKRNIGRQVTIDYHLNEQIAGGVTLDLSAQQNFITVQPAFAEFVPFENLRRLYKASGPIDAIAIGYKKTLTFIAQTYVSLKCLLVGLIGQRELSGPVGIITMSYQIAAKQPLIDYVHFLGMISVLLAVFNFLPLPPFDGGLFVLLMVEKAKGSALSERTQGVIAYAGVVFIAALFIYLTFNDIANMFFR